jgi:hypothetical protein
MKSRKFWKIKNKFYRKKKKKKKNLEVCPTKSSTVLDVNFDISFKKNINNVEFCTPLDILTLNSN